MSKHLKIDVTALIDSERIQDVANKALANLKKDGGSPELAYTVVNVGYTDSEAIVGAGASKQRGSTSIEGPLESAIADWFKNGGDTDNCSPYVLVTYVDGPRIGTAMSDAVSLENYEAQPKKD